MPKVRWVMSYEFLKSNFICFPAMQTFGKSVRFDKVTESLKVGTFLETQCISFFNCDTFN